MFHPKRFRLAVCTALCLAGGGVTPLAIGQAYILTDLGTLGAVSTNSSGGLNINDAGQVVGFSTDITGSFFRAAFWNGISISDLGTLGGFQGVASGINNTGQVVGESTTAGYTPWHATFWNNSTAAPTDLGALPGYNNSSANNINNAEQIVGVSNSNSADATRATFWNSSASAPIDLGTLGGTNSYAMGINNTGQIVGNSSTTAGDVHATFWNSSVSAPIDLGTLGGTRSFARNINDAGTIVGSSYYVGGGTGTHALLWNGSLTDLGTLGGGSSDALDINNSGQVVGDSLTTVGDIHATLWNGSSIVDLNNVLDSSGVGWTLNFAGGINDAGQIAGSGRNPLGQSHAFLLTFCELCEISPWSPPSPIPEPEIFAMMLGGLGLFGFLARRRKEGSLSRRRPLQNSKSALCQAHRGGHQIVSPCDPIAHAFVPR